jgi:hypothetical protein
MDMYNVSSSFLGKKERVNLISIYQRETELPASGIFPINFERSSKSYVIRKTGDCGWEDVDIVTGAGHAVSIHNNHAFTANRAQGIYPKAVRVAFYSEDLALAVFRSLIVGARYVIIIEEAVKACAVNQRVGAVHDTHGEGVAVPRDTGAVVGIV